MGDFFFFNWMHFATPAKTSMMIWWGENSSSASNQHLLWACVAPLLTKHFYFLVVSYFVHVSALNQWRKSNWHPETRPLSGFLLGEDPSLCFQQKKKRLEAQAVYQALCSARGAGGRKGWSRQPASFTSSLHLKAMVTFIPQDSWHELQFRNLSFVYTISPSMYLLIYSLFPGLILTVIPLTS